MDRKTLDRALARYHLQQQQAKPTAETVLKALLAGDELPEIPEFSGDLPDFYPYNALPEHEARQLAYLTLGLPDKAPDLQGLWLSRS